MITAIPALMTFAATSAFAGSPDNKGVYVGAAYSQVKVKDSGEFDDDNGAYSLFLGAELNQHFRIEGEYTDFGSYGSGVANAETDGFSLAFKAGIPVSESFDIYAQIGNLWWDTDYQVLGVGGDIDGDEIFYGIGASFGLTEVLHLRLEYNRYEVEFEADETGPLLGSDREADLDQAKVGLSLYF